MRNLQKILALALALIMSFSLVVTANAAFSDEADISEAYTESVDVLSQLEVFKGYTDGTYQPQKSISRAEVAAIIYRIATGDVTDAQVAIYSDWNRFTDVHSGEWWAGYINYCANAEYIKGYGNGKFGPDDPVTGYEALAMILRAVGYGKMEGEFQGSDWAVQTAARANSLKVTRNVQNTALLNSAATRELVAELLCQAILVPTVEYNQFSGYTENDESLAKRSFDVERLEGVVMANEYADLEDDDTLANGKTRLDVDGRDVTLNVTSDLTAIGESRYAYVRKTSNNDYDMVCSKLYDTGKNVTNETGAEKDKVKDLVEAKSIKTVDETEYFINFDPDNSVWSSDWRIEYLIGETSLTEAQKEYLDNYNDDYAASTGRVTVENNWKDENENQVVAYRRWIAPNADINAFDQAIIETIFRRASLEETDANQLDIIINGEVYVGTQAKDDVSDELSFKQFKDKYIKTELTKFDKTTNGNWLKVVDNDNDGVVEYVFKTISILDEVVDSVTKDNKTTFYYQYLNTEDIDPAYIGEYEPEVGDIVVYAIIDGKAQMELAQSETATINSINYKDVTATSTDGTVYEQSDIINETDMDEQLVNMSEKTEYTLYKDHFGYVRAYTGPGNAYGLLTEVYPTRSYNSQLVKNTDLTVELTTPADNGTVKEYDVLNSYNTNTGMNVFFNENTLAWDSVTNTLGYENYLQRAIASLDLQGVVTTNRAGEEFDYDWTSNPQTNNDDHTWTNVAKYAMGEDGVNLYTASEYMYNKAGEQLYYARENTGDKWTRVTRAAWEAAYIKNVDGASATAARDAFNDRLGGDYLRYVYAEDYIQLTTADISAKQRHFDISSNYVNLATSNSYVNINNETDFYVVISGVNGRSAVQHFVGYSNLPEYTRKDNTINAVYAVAANTRADNADRDYWVADVVVIEIDRLSSVFTSVSLAYFNDRKTTDQVRYVQTLNNKTAGAEEELLPTEQTWPGRWDGNYGFYGLSDEKTNANGDKTADIDRIGPVYEGGRLVNWDYNANGIYAGTVTRVDELKDYIDVNLHNGNTKKDVDIDGVPIFAIKSGDTARRLYSAEYELTGCDIIYVMDKSDVAFIVVLNPVVNSKAWTSPSWLYDGGWTGGINADNVNLNNSLYEQIVADQNIADSDDTTVSYDSAMAAAKTALEANPQKKADLEAALRSLRLVDTGKLTDAERTALDKAIADLVAAIDALGGGETVTDGDLTVKSGVTKTSYFAAVDKFGRTLVAPGSAITIENYINKFAIPAGATVDWTFTVGGETYTVKSDSTTWNVDNKTNVIGIDINGASVVKAILTLSDGTTKEYNNSDAGWKTINMGTNVTAAASANAASGDWTNTSSVKLPVGTKMYFKFTHADAARGGTFYSANQKDWSSTVAGAAGSVISGVYTVGSLDDLITFDPGATITLTPATNTTNIELPATYPVTLANGADTYEAEVIVKDTDRITLSSFSPATVKGTAKIGAATTMSDGTAAHKWTISLTGVTGTASVNVNVTTNPKITINNADNGTGHIAIINNEVAGATHTVNMTGGETSGTLTVRVKAGYEPYVSSGPTGGFTLGSFVKGDKVGENYEWTAKYSNVTANGTVELNAQAETVVNSPDFNGNAPEYDTTNNKITISGSGESNISGWNGSGSNGVFPFTGADEETRSKLSVVVVNLRTFLSANGFLGSGYTSFAIVQENKALTNAYANDPSETYNNGIRISGGYTAAQMEEFSILLQEGEPVTLTIWALTDTAGDSTTTLTHSTAGTDLYGVEKFTITVDNNYTNTNP